MSAPLTTASSTTGRACLRIVLMGASFIAGCVGAPEYESLTELDRALTERDIHSFAVPEEARVTHVDLDLRTRFEDHRLAGSATLDLEIVGPGHTVVLDTRDLDVEAVTDTAGNALVWALGESDSVLGTPLTVELPEDTRQIVVHYETRPEAGALQWLAPEQTTGESSPYLYSQGQSILTRTWIPTQDSPGIRQTYTARIIVPSGLRALMSAEMLTPDGEPMGEGTAFYFQMAQPIPPYLIAIAVGDIAFRSVGPRTGVYSEPALVEQAAYEFADLEAMMTAAEELYGPYRWGRYDVLVLPPSFPFGGMENPRLTFATPTILAGDRSLVTLVAHELAHSWSGNLVTNATWSDFWLNEGFTTYFENRIMEALYGEERAEMLAHLGRQQLHESFESLGGPEAPDTRLHVDLTGRDPDDAFSQVPYEKGKALLKLIEIEVGRERWDEYLRGYFDRYAFGSMTTASFLRDLRAQLIQGDEELERRLRLEEWIYEPGLPENAPVPQSDAFARVEATAQSFAQGAPAQELDVAEWTTQEWQHFLGSLPEHLTSEQLANLDSTFALSEAGNSEILFTWLRIAVRHQYQPAMPALEEFLSSMGRRKFLQPLYEDLMEQDSWGQSLARRIYQEARPMYHYVAVNTLDPIVL